MAAPSAMSDVGAAIRLRNRDMNAPWRHVDVVLAVSVILTQLFGTMLISSATNSRSDGATYMGKQAVFVVAGIAVMGLVSVIDYRRYTGAHWLILGVAVLAVGGVLTPLGDFSKGAQAWYRIGSFQLQPAEPAKLAVILTLAAYLAGRDRIRVRELTVALVMLAVPMGLILLQPDLGTALVFIVVGAGILTVAGTPTRYLVGLVLATVVVAAVIVNSDALDRYQRDRLTAFANPGAASAASLYNTQRAQEAIGTGGWTGTGLRKGPQTQGGFVPEQQTDFIFTVAGEELGFAGAALLLGLLGIILWRVWRTAQLAADPLGRLICVGVLCMLGFHIFENVGMVLGIMPVTGIPLPFVSYGGSATITAFAAAGLVQSVHMHRYR